MKNTRTLLHFKANAHIKYQTHHLGLAQIKEKLFGIYGQYQNEKQHLSSNRDKWIDSLTSAQVAAGNSTMEKKLCSLRLQEHQRKMGQCVHYTQNKLKSGGITMILIPGEDTDEWIECTTKDIIE